MAHSSSVAQDLFALDDALDDPDVDLDSLLRRLVETVRAAVASSLGLRLTVGVGDTAVVLDTLTGAAGRAAVRTSLRVPLPTVAAVTASGLTLWAGTPGAFVDLAADLTVALGLPRTAIVLDDDLPVGAAQQGSGLATLSVVHQAVGVLIARGHSPEQARAELERRAATAGTATVVAAGLVLGSLLDRGQLRPPRS